MAIQDLVRPVACVQAPGLFARGLVEDVVQFHQVFTDPGDEEAQPGEMSEQLQGLWGFFWCTYCESNESEDGESIESLHRDNLKF
jgi:hypothetical protein